MVSAVSAISLSGTDRLLSRARAKTIVEGLGNRWGRGYNTMEEAVVVLKQSLEQGDYELV
jgi:hypothetical protein